MTFTKPSLLDFPRIAESKLNIDRRTWNWTASDDPSVNAPSHPPANYYEASLSDWGNADSLSGHHTCDVLIVGGGLLGASTALHLAEAGVDTILVDKDNIGSAASGRNGGQITPGLARWEASDMIDNLSFEDAKRLWRFASVEAMELIDEIAQRYGLDFDRKRGHITAAVHPGHMSALIEGADARRWLGDDQVDIVGKYELQQYVRSDIYHGASVDHMGGQIHPLALARGLIHGFRKNGGRVYEHTEVIDIEETGAVTVATTPGGTITAKQGVVLALHNATFKFLSNTHSTTVPFYTYVSVTKPLQEDVRSILPADMPVYDTQFQIDYYRAVRDNRLLFGGQGTGSCWSPQSVNDYLLGRIQTVFPQLPTPELEFSWSGISDFTLNGATDCRKTGERVPVYLVHGWSGHGVAQTVRIGRAISDDLIGKNDDFQMLTEIEHKEIPLGRQLSPLAIPVVKAAMGMVSTFSPGRLISF